VVLVDTSVWVCHFREGHSGLAGLLNDGRVACHPFVLGELACGNLKDRAQILSLLNALPKAIQATHDEIMVFIENHGLMGRGLGYIDIHLLASAVLTGIPMWTFDKRLEKAAEALRCGYIWK
jgi:predicted nucleic acid-binding protein